MPLPFKLHSLSKLNAVSTTGSALSVRSKSIKHWMLIFKTVDHIYGSIYGLSLNLRLIKAAILVARKCLFFFFAENEKLGNTCVLFRAFS